MDRFSFLITPHYMSLLIGIGLILLALISVYFEVVPVKGGRIYLAKSPKSFWFVIAVCLLAGGYFIGDFLSQTN